MLFVRPEPTPNRVGQTHCLLIAITNATDLVSDHGFTTLLSKMGHRGLHSPGIWDLEPQTIGKDLTGINGVIVRQHLMCNGIQRVVV